jgi:hypothetical protein
LIAEPSKTSPKTDGRLPGLDALRTASMIAVVAAHAAYAYVSCRLAGLPWAVRDPKRSFLFDMICWSSISWAMPAFFTLGGFAAAAIWTNRGPEGYLRDRLRRIALPAIAAVPLVLVPSLLVWTCGWFVSGRINYRQAINFVFVDRELRDNRMGPAHLWFLEFLMIMLVVYGLVRLYSKRPSFHLPSAFFSGFGAVTLAVPTMLFLWIGHRLNGLDPIMDMRNSFIPNPFRLLHHGWFFAVGTWIYGSREELRKLQKYPLVFLAIAIAAFSSRAGLVKMDSVQSLQGLNAWLSVASAALFGWFSLFGFIGLALTYFSGTTPLVRYLADSSYWIYLTHFPIVGLVQVGLYHAPWPPEWKFLISLVVTLGFGLLSYHGLVRYTIIGKHLHGSRVRTSLPTN